eukprot:CAMPEP_0171905002 /NCGR_PEP_ID=MMETSP0993-20121228/4731_1 /TAXON_ID=483369 /ORGANISM="non described non described, Strain CCMP2098" /LENGTH=32 /DNA_ID= /DNA_START= /DNA_END= /DNA_ORIENTATION=
MAISRAVGPFLVLAPSLAPAPNKRAMQAASPA